MHSISTYIKVLLGFNIGVLVFASIVFYWFLPLVRVRFCVSKEHFKFDLQNNLFLKVFWRDIELLEVIKVKWRCYKINYIKLNQTKTLRLFLLQFSRKKTILILKLLKEFAENTNVNFKEGKIEAYNNKDTWKDWVEIRKIIQSVKKLSSHPKTEKFNNFNRLKQERDLLKTQGEVRLAKKNYKSEFKYAEAVVNMEERREFKKTWYHSSKKIGLIQLLLIWLLILLPPLGSVFNLPDSILSGILIGISITLFISLFLLIVSLRKPQS